MKKIIIAFVFISLSASVSCSKSDSPEPIQTAGTGTVMSGQFQKRVLIEDFTGAWCGYCPRVSYAIDQLKSQNAKIVPVALHHKAGSISSDPYDVSALATPLRTQINLQGYPTAMLNRVTEWDAPENSNLAQVQSLASTSAGLGLAMSSSVSGGSISLDVKIKFASDFSGLSLVVYILEDNLIYNQTNYTSFYGGTSTIVGFEHDHVLRASLTNILGDALVGSTITGQTITKNFTVSVPTNIANVSNMTFVAFVVDGSKKAINARAANSGENQSFEINP